MKVAVVTDSYFPTRDGVVACIEAMRPALASEGVETVVVAPDPGEAGRREGVVYFPSVRFSGYAGYYVPVFPSNKMEVMRGIAPDVVHVQGIAAMALKGIIAAHQLGIPVVVTFHTMVGDAMKYYSPVPMPPGVGERLVWIYLRYLTKWADAVVAPSRSTAEELRAHGVAAPDMRVIPTCVDASRFSPEVDGSRVRARYGLEGRRVVVCVGRVSYEKGIDVLIRALAELDGDVVLMVVGKGPASEDLKALAEGLGLGGRVLFTGFVPDAELPEHYAAADAAATASRFETQCLCAIEAMATGLPVACAAARAFTDYVVDGENGFLFSEDSECAQALRRALSAGPEVRRRAVETAAGFSAESFASSMAALYRDVAARKAAEGRRCST